MATELKAGDPVTVTIEKNGYWKDSRKGRVVAVTEKSYFVDYGSFTNRRFPKTTRNLSPRVV